MPHKEVLILKLGGSIVTLKHLSQPAIRRRHMERVATVLAKHYDPKKHSLILIHGAGSFGHVHAHTHGLAQGTKDHPEKTYRAIENQSLDAHLNAELTTILIKTGLPVVGMPSRTLAINSYGILTSLETKSITTALSAGAIPLLHGDMVFDMTWGLSICSGDVLAAELAHTFRARQVFFASDVDGIFSKDPHQHKDACLIRKTTLADIANGNLNLGTSHNIDVTGGLAKKFSLFRKNASLENIYLFNGMQKNNFSFVFNQKKFFGTEIEV